jgi:hypothetical protein
MANEIALIDPKEYPVLLADASLAETILGNMAGESVSPSDLNRIKVPAGGSTTWVYQDSDGEEKSAKTLDGIIVHIARRRAYWPSKKLTGERPTCSSDDAIRGVGTPGGLCGASGKPGCCPYNEFGSAVGDDGTPRSGKACKEKKLIFILRPGQMLPDIVDAPPSSLKQLRTYQFRLGVPFCSIVTRLALVKPTKIGIVPPEQVQQIMAYAQALQTVFAQVSMEEEGRESF